jgi:predicted transposase YbfD/YdcC
MVSAFAARQRLVLGQVKVAEKSKEIVAIPKLLEMLEMLEMLEIEGAIVTIDAMGCQRGIAQKAIDKKADCLLALKGNQSSLQADVAELVAEQRGRGSKDTTIGQHRTIDGDHGRIEARDITVIHDVGWLQQRHAWPGLKGVVIVDSTREIGDKIEKETRFYITSWRCWRTFSARWCVTTGRSRTACTGFWTWSCATANAG